MRSRHPEPHASPRSRVRLAVTMGDPAGIGPEVALKAIATPAVSARVEPILVGDLAVWQETARRLGLRLELRPASLEPGKAGGPRAVEVVVTSTLPERYRVPGAPHGRAGRQGVRCGGLRGDHRGGASRASGGRCRRGDGADQQGAPGGRGPRLPGAHRVAGDARRRGAGPHDDGGPAPARRPGDHAPASGRRAAPPEPRGRARDDHDQRPKPARPLRHRHAAPGRGWLEPARRRAWPVR